MRFRRAERWIESEAPAIVAIARQLTTGEVETTTRATYDWVVANIKRAEYGRRTRGASYALQARRGDCTEMTYLLVALLRSNDIAARPIGGYVYSESA